jgi:uncharacterized DUF497 family protein
LPTCVEVPVRYPNGNSIHKQIAGLGYFEKQMSLVFEWDPLKAEKNRSKHGITFMEGSTAFSDSHSLTIPDPDHSLFEHRALHLGLSQTGTLVVVSYTERSVRIIIFSVRHASKRERKHYEENPL